MEFISMKLVIHDLTAEEWEKVKQDYEGDQIISDSGTIRPCVGCFGCWNKPLVNVCSETDMKTKRSAFGAKNAECALF